MESSRADLGTDMLRIGVRTLDSRTYWVLVHKDILIIGLKEVLSSPTGIPRERQRLLYRGGELSDGDRLSSYNVQNDHILHLVTGQPNAAASSGNLNPPFVNGVDSFPFNIRFHGYGPMGYAREIISFFSTGLIMSLPGNPDVPPEDSRLMTSLSMEALRLMQSSRGRGRRTHIAMVPYEQPLVHMLHSTTSLLNNLNRSVYMMRSMIAHQSRNPELFQQRLVNNARILRTQLWNSSQFLHRLGCVMHDLTTRSTMPEAAVNLPTQPGRTRSRTRNNGASSSNADVSDLAENRNTRPRRRRRGNDM